MSEELTNNNVEVKNEEEVNIEEVNNTEVDTSSETVDNNEENIDDDEDIIEQKKIMEEFDKKGKDLSDRLAHALSSFIDNVDPTTLTFADVSALLDNMKVMMGTLETMWFTQKSTYGITDDHIKKLMEFNYEHRVKEEDFVSEEGKTYDHYNGIDCITESDVINIFGEGSAIIEKKHENTISNIKNILETFFAWLSALKEYNNIYNGYMDLVEESENKNMDKLKERAEACENEEQKANMLAIYDEYYRMKYLDFLQNKISEKNRGYILKAFTDEKKVQYWLNRGREKLEEIKFSAKFILEISQFETRFLPEKYHGQNNILLLYFLHSIIYADLKNSKSKDKAKIVAFVIAMDRLIRNRWSDEIRERIINNVIAFENQFVDEVSKNNNIKKEDKNDNN